MRRIIILLAAIVLVTGCDRKLDPPSDEERQAILQDAPQIIGETDGRVYLHGLESVYLGQPKDEALEQLTKLCPKAMEYRAGAMGKNAWFRGCVFSEARDNVVSVRVGFWPHLEDRVATLEVKRTDVSIEAVRERFRDFVEEVTVDLPRPGLLEMRSPNYQIMVDNDEGSQGPVHITLGYPQNGAEKLTAK